MTPRTQFVDVPLVYETGTKRQQYILKFVEKVKETKTQNKGETEMKKKPSLNIFVTLLLTKKSKIAHIVTTIDCKLHIKVLIEV